VCPFVVVGEKVEEEEIGGFSLLLRSHVLKILYFITTFLIRELAI